MANRIKMAVEHSILVLDERGWSYRRIARELGIHRETVSRYVHLARAGLEPAKVTAGNSGQRSHCEPFRSVIEGMLELGLSAQRIYQDLVAGHDFPGSYSSVKRFVRRLRAVSPLPFRRLECDPGEEVQVDFGRGAPVVDSTSGGTSL